MTAAVLLAIIFKKEPCLTLYKAVKCIRRNPKSRCTQSKRVIRIHGAKQTPKE